MTQAIEIHDLGKTYRGKKMQKVVALNNLSLEVAPGQVFGFLGPNGAGKSTTIKLLTGQIKPSAGSATLFGTPVVKTEARRNLGYLPENPSFYDFLTAYEYLYFVGKVFSMSRKTLTAEIVRVLEVVDLTAAAKRPIRGYSKGMVQRLGIAQAVLHGPDLYILDEPMSGLDPIGRALVKDIIVDLKKQGKTIFFSTHITNDVESVCDRFAILNKGNLEVTATVDEIIDVVGGYSVVYIDNKGKASVHCSEKELTNTIQSVLQSGGRVEKVIPQRRSLEEFFLSTVQEANGDSE